MRVTNERRCLLAENCRLAGGDKCTNHCGAFIAMHGLDGAGGRAGSANMPTNYRLTTLINSPVRESQPKVYDMLDAYTKTFSRQFGDEDSKRIKSMYLWSTSPGTGKTTTASALLNEWLRVHYIGSIKRGKQPIQQPAYFLDVNEWQTDYNLATMTDDDEAMAKIKADIKRCQNVPYLVMDDIGVRGATEAFRSYLHAIINRRTAAGMPTVYTSNLPIEEMTQVFEKRMYDRMRHECVVVPFAGESKRGGK